MTMINQSTRLVKPGKTEEDTQYPVYLRQVKKDNPSWSFPREVEEEVINNLGYFKVENVDRPQEQGGKSITEGKPVLRNGSWHQDWVITDLVGQELQDSLNQKKEQLSYQVSNAISNGLNKGFEYDFGGAVEHVQLRDGDRANHSGVFSRASTLKAEGVTDAVIPFRTYENNIHMLTPDEAIDMCNEAYEAYLEMLGKGWAMKDEIANAQTFHDLPVVPNAFTR